MKIRFRHLIFIAMGFYSLTLLTIEANTSQDYVRQYFTDISGNVRFYAVNTTLSAFLLWSTALLFACSLAVVRGMGDNQKEKLFFISQMIIFFYMGMDDRFQIHDDPILMETIGPQKGNFTLIAVGIMEIFFLVKYGQILTQKWVIQRPLLLASIFFLIMFIIDVTEPKNMPLRLSFEDLFKTWANFFFFLFAWGIFLEKLDSLKAYYSNIAENKEKYLVPK
jgi:hypothetical protein